MTPPHPSNWLKRLIEVGRPHKTKFSKGARVDSFPSHREFKASQLRNLNSVVFSLHH